MKTFAVIAAVALAIASSSAALAQTPPAVTPAPAAKPATPPPAATPPSAQAPSAQAPSAAAKKERTPESLKCSADADAKNLHGSERKKFRDKCMRDAKKAAKAPDPAVKPVEPKKN